MRRVWSRWAVAVLVVEALLVGGCRPLTSVEGGAGNPQPATAGGDAQEQASGEPVTLNVFAAASLTDAFDEIGRDFAAAYRESGGKVDVVFNYGGSNQLATQIGEGAPADVFASANQAQMQVAIDSGRIGSGTRQTFVRNRLVVVTPKDNPGRITALEDLARPGVKIVLAAPEAPIGQYALDFLDKAEAGGSLGTGYKGAVLANIASYEENVRSVLIKVMLGEADAGIVYTSDAAVSAGEVQQLAIPDDLNTIATYPIAVVGDSLQPQLAEAFVAYVLGPKGQQVLKKYGFLGVDE